MNADIVTSILDEVAPNQICADLSGLVDCTTFLVPTVISTLLACICTGIILSQCQGYFWHYYHRRLPRRPWTLAVVVLSLVCQITVATTDFYRTIDAFALNFGSYDNYLTPGLYLIIGSAATTLAQGLTQLFLLYRAWAFSRVKLFTLPQDSVRRSRWIVNGLLAFLAVLILVSCTASVTAAVQVHNIGNFMLLALRSKRTVMYDVAMPTWLATASFIDVALAAMICWELYLPKKERFTGFTFLHDRILAFIRIVVQSGVVLAALQVGALIAWQYQLAQTDVLRWSSWLILPSTILGRYYTINLMLVISIPRSREGDGQLCVGHEEEVMMAHEGPFGRQEMQARDDRSPMKRKRGSDASMSGFWGDIEGRARVTRVTLPRRHWSKASSISIYDGSGRRESRRKTSSFASTVQSGGLTISMQDAPQETAEGRYTALQQDLAAYPMRTLDTASTAPEDSSPRAHPRHGLPQHFAEQAARASVPALQSLFQSASPAPILSRSTIWRPSLPQCDSSTNP